MEFPSVLVTDTNIWIDLQNGGILEKLFLLPFHFIAPDFAITEYSTVDWKELDKLGVEFCEIAPEEIQKIVFLKSMHPGLSVVDLSALLLAEERKAVLITGDKNLRILAVERKNNCHGVLWILDILVAHQIINGKTAASAMAAMIQKGARLPEKDCNQRLENWQK